MRGFQPAQGATKTKRPAGNARGFANGGPVRGPGTGTSDDIKDEVPEGTYIMPADSTEVVGEGALAEMGAPAARGFNPGQRADVPVQLSNGEYKLPPEQVHAVGVQALDQIKSATHTPSARGFNSQQAQYEEPRQFFANGGVVDDDERRRAGAPGTPSNTWPGHMPARSPYAPAGAPPAAPAAPEVPPPTGPANTAAVTSGAAFGVFRRPETAGSRGGMMAPVVATGPRTFEPGMSMDPGAMRLDAATDPRSLTFQGNGPAPAAPYTGAGFRPGAAAAPVSSSPATAAPRAPQPQAAVQPGAPGRAGFDPGTAGQSAAPPAAQAAQIEPGIYRRGNSYSDSADGAVRGFNPNGGQVSAQNMAAADALEARGLAERAAERAAGDARGFQPAGVGVIADGDAARREARNASVGSSMTTVAGARGMTSSQRNDITQRMDSARRDATARATTEANNAAALQREQMQQSGANSRSVLQEAGANARAGASTAIQAGDLALRQEAQGFQTRAARELEQVRAAALDPKATAEQRQQALQSLNALQGKNQSQSLRDNFMTVGGGQEWDATAGVMRNVPQRLVDLRTGQDVSGQPGQGTQSSGPPKVGAVQQGFRFKGGNPADRNNWERI